MAKIFIYIDEIEADGREIAAAAAHCARTEASYGTSLSGGRALWIKAGADAPFGIFKYLKFAFGAGLHPKCLFNLPAVRGKIAEAFKKSRGYAGEFGFAKLPYETLRYLDFTEKNTPPALPKNAVFDASKSDAENAEDAVERAKSGRDVFLRLARDAGLRLARKIAAALPAPENEIQVYSPVAMPPAESEIDLRAALRKTGLKHGKDYIAFFEKTSARFWFAANAPEAEIRKVLEESGARILSDAERERLGIADAKFGDAVAAVLTRARIARNFGLSAYSEDGGIFLSSNGNAAAPNSPADFAKRAEK